MKEEILATIRDLQKKREDAHIQPAHALLSEIINRGYAHPQEDINALFCDGLIAWHRTINEIAFTINNDTEKQHINNADK